MSPLPVDPLTGNLINNLGGLGAYQFEWRSDNIWLARSWGENGEISFINTIVNKTPMSIQSAAGFNRLTWKPDGSQLVTVSESGVMQVWDMSGLPDLSGTPTITPYPIFTPTQEPTAVNKK